MDRPAQYRRHDLVRVGPASWTALLAARRDLDGVPHLRGWMDAGRPLIVRRSVPGEARDHVPLGLPLPPADGKRRIGFTAPAAALIPCAAPTLDEARAAAPLAWQPTLDALDALGQRLGIVPRPYGSLLWQAVTGLTYLAVDSDLDLLWPTPHAELLPGLTAGLAAIAAGAPMRLDGEILLPDGAGLHWHELLEAPDEGDVLVKHLDRLELRPVSTVRAQATAGVKP